MSIEHSGFSMSGGSERLISLLYNNYPLESSVCVTVFCLFRQEKQQVCIGAVAW
jgi:hypothetical protein